MANEIRDGQYIGAVKGWDQPARVDGARANPTAAIVLDANDDLSSITSKLVQQGALVSGDDAAVQHASHAAMYSNAVGEARVALELIDGDELLSPEGKKQRAAQVIRAAEERLTSGEVFVKQLESDAEEMESTMAYTGDETTTEAELMFAMSDLQKVGPVEAGRRFMASATKPISEWRKSDGVTVEAAMRAADLGTAVVDPMLLSLGWGELKKGHPRAGDVEASRNRAAAVRAAVGAGRTVLKGEMRRYGIGEEK